jgi:hypothetical protein
MTSARTRPSHRVSSSLATLLLAASLALPNVVPARSGPAIAAGHVKVTPSVRWRVRDDTGTRDSTTRFASFVARDDVPFVLDLLPVDVEHSLRVTFRVHVDGDMAIVRGTSVWEMQLGVTTATNGPNQSMDGTTVRRYTTRLHGRQRLGTDLVITCGEDIDDTVSIVLVFERTHEPASRFDRTPIE